MVDAYPFLQRIFFDFFQNLGSKSTQNHRKIPFLLPLLFGGVFKFSPGFFRCVFPYFESRTRCRPKFGPLARGCSSHLRCLLGGHVNRFVSDNGRSERKSTVKPPRFWRNKDLLNVVCMKFMSSDVNQNVLTHQFIWTAITYQSMWITSYESISNHITQSISIPIRVTLPPPKNGPFLCSIARNFCISKITWLSQKRRQKVPWGGSIWSTSKHGRETYPDPIFTEGWKTQTHGNLGEQVCFGLEEKWDWLSRKGFQSFCFEYPVVSEFRNKKTSFFINT